MYDAQSNVLSLNYQVCAFNTIFEISWCQFSWLTRKWSLFSGKWVATQFYIPHSQLLDTSWLTLDTSWGTLAGWHFYSFNKHVSSPSAISGTLTWAEGPALYGSCPLGILSVGRIRVTRCITYKSWRMHISQELVDTYLAQGRHYKNWIFFKLEERWVGGWVRSGMSERKQDVERLRVKQNK